MNDLCADIGYKSLNHYGEQLCGDHVDIVEQIDGSTVVVLAKTWTNFSKSTRQPTRRLSRSSKHKRKSTRCSSTSSTSIDAHTRTCWKCTNNCTKTHNIINNYGRKVSTFHSSSACFPSVRLPKNTDRYEAN